MKKRRLLKAQATLMKAELIRLVKEENPEKPLLDEELAAAIGSSFSAVRKWRVQFDIPGPMLRYAVNQKLNKKGAKHD